MNLVILEGFLGTAPKQIAKNTFAIRVAVEGGKREDTLWVDGLLFDESLCQGLAAGTKVNINGRLSSISDGEGKRSPKVLVDTLEIKQHIRTQFLQNEGDEAPFVD